MNFLIIIRTSRNRSKTVALVAQRQSAYRCQNLDHETLVRMGTVIWLITRRSRDRNPPRALFYRHGAVGARGAHNSEVIRSKRIAGITDVAQRKSAEPITPRSQDRNLSSVPNYLTGVAQWKRAGRWLKADNPRSWDRNPPPVKVKLDLKNVVTLTGVA